MLKRRPPKFPLQMSNGMKVRNIVDLRNNADSVSLLNYFFRGTLINWCLAHNNDEEAEKLFELNNIIVGNICDILGIEYSDNMVIDNFKRINYYSEKSDSPHIINQFDTEFAEYSKDKINLRNYEIEFIPFDYGSNLFGTVEVRIHNVITELTLNCIVSYTDANTTEENNLNTEFFDKVISIIMETEKINKCCSRYTSGSGGYGYGLELI